MQWIDLLYLFLFLPIQFLGKLLCKIQSSIKILWAILFWQHKYVYKYISSWFSIHANWDGKQNITLFMPHGVDESEDAYLCSAYRVRDWNGIEPVYIRSFNISSSNKLLHHMVIHACGHLNKQPGDVWYVYWSNTMNKIQIFHMSHLW